MDGVDLEAAFAAADAHYAMIKSFLAGQAMTLTHAEVETELAADGRNLLRYLFQGHLDLRSEHETRQERVVDAHGTPHNAVEKGHERKLKLIFGDVVVRRFAYRHDGSPNLYPADASLNLPREQFSHGLRQKVAIEAARGSFEEAQEAIARATGQLLGKRQIEELAERSAQDVTDFYASAPHPSAESGDLLVLSADGKGIVMRPEALRPATAKAALASSQKISTRLSKGEKPNRKRMAEVGAVYDATPVPRTPADVLGQSGPGQDPKPAPEARGKWFMASVVEDAACVITQIFDEAERRDPEHQRTWLALVDGNSHQIDRIQAEAQARAIDVHIVIDFIHVLEYLWSAAWSFFAEGDAAAEAWVLKKANAVLTGNAAIVAAAIRRKATTLKLEKKKREGADKCAAYLLNKQSYLDYPTALAQGWPIATGVIEGACRHLVKDRMDITGARWGLKGAEAVLKLRALRQNGDFEAYWRYHLAQEYRRVHQERYLNHRVPQAA